MIYIVSGYRRSGTSMMMKALHAGGLAVIEMEEKGRTILPEINGYNPNPSGLYEVGRGFYMNPHFLRNIPDESLIKIFFDGLVFLPRREYKIIFMLRGQEEIEASIEKAEAHIRACGVVENKSIPLTFDIYRPYNQGDIDHVTEICEARADIRIYYVHFDDVIDNPIGTFERLRGLGFPVNTDKAARVINPKFRRFYGYNQAAAVGA